MTKEIAKFTISLKPYTKKNSPQIVTNKKTGRAFLLPSKQYMQYERDARAFIPKLDIDYPVNIEAHYYVDSNRKYDRVNLEEALLDVLVKYRCLADDNYKIAATSDGSFVAVDRKNPRTEVIITRKE